MNSEMTWCFDVWSHYEVFVLRNIQCQGSGGVGHLMVINVMVVCPVVLFSSRHCSSLYVFLSACFYQRHILRCKYNTWLKLFQSIAMDGYLPFCKHCLVHSFNTRVMALCFSVYTFIGLKVQSLDYTHKFRSCILVAGSVKGTRNL